MNTETTTEEMKKAIDKVAVGIKMIATAKFMINTNKKPDTVDEWAAVTFKVLSTKYRNHGELMVAVQDNDGEHDIEAAVLKMAIELSDELVVAYP